MNHGKAGAASLAAAAGWPSRELKQLLPGLNALAEALLLARHHHADPHSRALTVSRLATLGFTHVRCRDLLEKGLIAAEGSFKSSARVTLTDAGLAFLQRAIPAGAIRPIYDVASRELSVAGEIVIPLPVQARNLSAFLAAIEVAGWAPRVADPLKERPCGGSAHYLAVTAHRLTLHQPLIDFHADDGAATWNWRPSAKRMRRNRD